LIGLAALAVFGLASVRTRHPPDHSRDYPPRPLPAAAEPVLLPPPEMDDEYFPCSDCHEDEETNPAVRELEEEHDDLRLEHGDLWCLHCHDSEDRDVLHLTNGARVQFEDSWQLCTQCHGEKLADWRAGVHGKRTGHWRGTAEYWPCVRCHDPHAPRYRSLEPKPPPLPPEQIVRSGRLRMEDEREEP